MKKYSKNKHHELNELNITPLLDLCFVLLVIFILTTAPPVNDMEITLPSAGQNTKEKDKKNIQWVQISSDGKIKLNDTPMNEQQLLDTLVAFRKEDADLSVMVRADSALAVQSLVNVLDVLISANVAKFGLATEPIAKAN
jgi:biopolymer transport protein ExbD